MQTFQTPAAATSITSLKGLLDSLIHAGFAEDDEQFDDIRVIRGDEVPGRKAWNKNPPNWRRMNATRLNDTRASCQTAKHQTEVARIFLRKRNSAWHDRDSKGERHVIFNGVLMVKPGQEGKTMRLGVAKFHSPKSPMMSDPPRATASDSLSGTDVMAAMGMAQSQAGFGMAAFCGKHELSQNDQTKGYQLSVRINLHTGIGEIPWCGKAEGNTKAKVLQVLATSAYADYCRSAATPGASMQRLSRYWPGQSILPKTERWGRVVEKECGDAKASAIQGCQQAQHIAL